MTTNGDNRPDADGPTLPDHRGATRVGARVSVIARDERFDRSRRFRRSLVVFLLGATLVVNALRLALDVFGGAGAASAWDNPVGSPFCNNVAVEDEARLERGFAEMVRTGEGDRLYRLLREHDVCVGVGDLVYQRGFSRPQRSPFANWSRSYVEVDRDYLRGNGADTVAALLIHEATHFERATRGVACWQTRSCEELSNGVAVDEELAAHVAEAAWWVAVHGQDGKPSTAWADTWLNRMAAAYLAGPEALRAWVVAVRSDPAESADW